MLPTLPPPTPCDTGRKPRRRLPPDDADRMVATSQPLSDWTTCSNLSCDQPRAFASKSARSMRIGYAPKDGLTIGPSSQGRRRASSALHHYRRPCTSNARNDVFYAILIFPAFPSPSGNFGKQQSGTCFGKVKPARGLRPNWWVRFPAPRSLARRQRPAGRRFLRST